MQRDAASKIWSRNQLPPCDSCTDDGPRRIGLVSTSTHICCNTTTCILDPVCPLSRNSRLGSDGLPKTVRLLSARSHHTMRRLQVSGILLVRCRKGHSGVTVSARRYWIGGRRTTVAPRICPVAEPDLKTPTYLPTTHTHDPLCVRRPSLSFRISPRRLTAEMCQMPTHPGGSADGDREALFFDDDDTSAKRGQ